MVKNIHIPKIFSIPLHHKSEFQDDKVGLMPELSVFLLIFGN